MSLKSVRTKILKNLLLVSVSALSLVSYQNCGEVALTKPVDLGGDVDVESESPAGDTEY